MKNIEIKQLKEKDALNADAFIYLGMSRRTAIEPVKIRKSCWTISLKEGKK